MRIAILGGSGMVGSAVVTEAYDRGHDVTAVSRSILDDPRRRITGRRADASQREVTRALIDSHDAIVSATVPERSAGGDHAPYLATIANLLEDLGDKHLLVVGGFGSLLQPNGEEQRYRPGGSVKKYRREASTVADGLAYIRAHGDARRWSYLCPPFMIKPVERTGRYVAGDDYPVGEEISTQDFAVAVLDELEKPRHIRRRFTVAGVNADEESPR
jgi:putative NADH-flavin reductase